MAIIALLVYVGVQITEGLGWLTAEEWMDDFVSLLWVFLLVILSASVFAVVIMVFLRLFKKPNNATSWDSLGLEDKDKEKDGS